MVTLESDFSERNDEVPASSPRPNGSEPPPPTSTAARGRPIFEGFLAIVAAVALVAGFYAFGRAIDDDAATDAVAATDGGSGGNAVETAEPAPPADDPVAAVPDAAHGHDDAPAVDDRGFALLENGEQHHEDFTQALDPATRQELARQLELAHEVAMKYPTVADAEAAGMRRAGPFSPGLGAHYLNFGTAAKSFTGGAVADGDEFIQSPIAWIYDGTNPDSRIAGLFYSASGDTPPEGFAGPNDIWHKHSNVCIVNTPTGIDTPLGADHDIDPADCRAVGGNLIPQTGYLLHVWVVPGYESPEGVFSHLSSAVTCPDGSYYTIDRTQVGTRATICRDAA